jgi:hypothetical protein
MKTNKQNKTNKKRVAANAAGSELKNRTEQLSETETAKTSETETEPKETGTVNAPVKPFVNFAERDFNRKFSVEKVLEKLERWMPEQFQLARVVGKWIWISFPEPPIERIRAPNFDSLASIGTTPANAGSTLAGKPSHADSRNPAKSTALGLQMLTPIFSKRERNNLNRSPHETMGHGWQPDTLKLCPASLS